jgi:hypothetical protein
MNQDQKKNAAYIIGAVVVAIIIAVVYSFAVQGP